MVLSSYLFSAARSSPELAFLISQILASFLIGAVYFGLPIGLLRLASAPLARRQRPTKLHRLLGIGLLLGIGGLAAGEFLASTMAIVMATSAIALSSIFLSATITSALISKYRRVASPFAPPK